MRSTASVSQVPMINLSLKYPPCHEVLQPSIGIGISSTPILRAKNIADKRSRYRCRHFHHLRLAIACWNAALWASGSGLLPPGTSQCFNAKPVEMRCFICKTFEVKRVHAITARSKFKGAEPPTSPCQALICTRSAP